MAALPYWEYEYMLDEINKTVEKENKEQNDGRENYSMENIERSVNRMSNRMSSQNKFSAPSMPRMPNMPKI